MVAMMWACDAVGRARWALIGLAAFTLACTSDPEPQIAAVPDGGAMAADAESDVSVLDTAGLDTAEPVDPTAHTRDWMGQLLAGHPGQPIRLVDITVPRSHDTGTYSLTTCTFGATACNTQTQHLSMQKQLEAGIRVFDVRPVLSDNGYFSHHTTGCDGLGCEGASITEILSHTRAFVDAHAELVVLQVGHYCNTSANDDGLVALVAKELGPRLYLEAEPPAEALIHRDLQVLIPPEGGVGQVVVSWEGLADTPSLRAEGRIASSSIAIQGGWSNKQLLDDLVADQLARYAAFEHDGTALFEFSWTMTMDAELAAGCLYEDEPRSIESMAAETNGALVPNLDALLETGAIKKGRIPHFLSVDYADVFVTEQAIRLSKLNLD